LIDYDERNLIANKSKYTVTEKEVLTIVRTQQHQFRENLLKHLQQCPITLIKDKRLLVASHIKPWCLSNDIEKLDINNGFILSPLYDKLFDSGLITFSHRKELIISSSLDQDTISKLNIKKGIYNNLPIKGREKYLEFHNEKIFIE
ncbi:MAG: HNH endonuclease, partial [Oscillospiraceae bacterium]|nr:HNH endonuclease [Oscillospiraceae bacterium]